jgi:hypothetical protein
MKQAWRRRLTYGSNASLVTVMVLAVLVGAYVLASQYRHRWDLTTEGRNTLHADTLAKLTLLDADQEAVRITAFSSQRGKDGSRFKNREMKDLLRELGDQSQVIDWALVDFDRERLTAEKLGVTEYGHVVVQRGTDRVDLKAREVFRRVGKGKARRFQFVGEQAISRAFSQLHTPRRRVVYVLSGHGEASPEDRSPSGLSDLAAALDGERYDVELLDLDGTDRDGRSPIVPDDAAVVLLPATQAPLSPAVEDVLLAYLGRGGGLWIAADVGSPVPDLLGRLGISVDDGVALDPRFVFPFWDRPIPRVRNHPTTVALQARKLRPVFARAAPLRIAELMPDGVQASPVLLTSRSGWIERGGRLEGGAPVKEEGVDILGASNLAVALTIKSSSGIVRKGRPPARVLVQGDGDALSNALLGSGAGNTSFALDTVHWLAGADTRLATGGSRRTKIRRLALTQQETGTLRWVSMGILPSVVAVLGLMVAWSRRRQ